ncbi:type II toxin-antitoxin system VapC family toxin [archaeon]|nr:type II toxin-antitoxin system VapC family toxin [archaeon]
MIAVDSNIWIYYLDPTTEEHEKVKSELERVILSEEILTSTIIWMEVSHYLFKVSRLPRGELGGMIKKLLRLSTLRVADFDFAMLNESLDMLSERYRGRIGGRDATILAMMQDFGVKRIMTHDKGFKGLGLEVIDPV